MSFSMSFPDTIPPVVRTIVRSVYGGDAVAALATPYTLEGTQGCSRDEYVHADCVNARTGKNPGGSTRATYVGAHWAVNADREGKVLCALGLSIDCEGLLEPSAMRGCHLSSKANGGNYCLHNVVIGCGTCNDLQADTDVTFDDVRTGYRWPVATVKATVMRLARTI